MITDARCGQRERALVKANEVRLARAELKHQIAEGEITAASVLRKMPPAATGWLVGDFLVAQHRWGPSRMRKLLWKMHINETKALGALTDRQRQMLAVSLESQT